MTVTLNRFHAACHAAFAVHRFVYTFGGSCDDWNSDCTPVSSDVTVNGAHTVMTGVSDANGILSNTQAVVSG